MDRFYDKIGTVDVNGCWIWAAANRGKTGYGSLRVNGKVVDAHRFSFELHKGEIPFGLVVMHSCDNRLCVNPDHLSAGSKKDNMQDCKKKGRMFTPVNLPSTKHPSLASYRRGCRCSGCREMQKLRRRDQRARGIKT